ncbi:hypothetical protein L2E82_15039 [Cichorium intybus]|uniref:Uncharacterized protein n=1 Tax=Cichorium intybus TaxID=13427 RepID=A0ACB9F2L0_CICIN|nr:hypothetical protein L2E82_15039 [Cichorium intybus]
MNVRLSICIHLPTDKLRPAYFIINGFVYFIQICIWMYIRFSKTAAAVEIAELFFSACAVISTESGVDLYFIYIRHSFSTFVWCRNSDNHINYQYMDEL